MRQHLALPLLALFALVLLPTPTRAQVVRPCGTSDGTARQPNATDALFVLQGAVGVPGSCGHCLCDVDSSGEVSAVDALITLRRAVGIGFALHCPACACTAVTRLVTGFRPSSVVASDIDDDGVTDLITADLESDEVSIFYGRGRGVFGERQAIAVDDTPQSVTVADLDDDGHLDIVVSDALPNGLTLLFGQGDREFERADNLIPTGDAPINSVAIDVNGDEMLDLVVANSLSDDISVLIGHGDGTFDAEVRYPVGIGPRWLAMADMDGDDILDVVTANRDSSDLSILSGDGDGVFGNERRIGGDVYGPYHVSIADVDGNQRPDMIVAGNVNGEVAVFLAKADHSFEDPVHYVSGTNTIQTSVALVNDDAFLDVVAVNYQSGAHGVSTFLGNGDGTFEAPTYEPSGSKARSVVAADIDGDGTTDVVAANATADDLTILHGAGDGSFVGITESDASPQTHELIVADFDHDGFDDVATADQADTITSYRSTGTGLFGLEQYPVGAHPIALFAGRITGNSETDIIATGTDSFEFSVHQSIVLVGAGDATFNLSPVSSELVTGEPIRGSTAAGDIDGDGLTDLAIAVGDIIALRLGQADASFESFDELPAAATFPAIAIADLDGDGDDDLVELIRDGHVVRVHRNKGSGDFASPVSYDVTASFNLDVHDVDGDGRNDVVATSGDNDGTISVLRGDGHGGLRDEVVSHAGQLMAEFTIDDFDGDHAADLAAVFYDGRVVVLPGDAKGHFGHSHSAATVAFSPGGFPAFVESGYFDSLTERSLVLAGRKEGRGNRLQVLREIGECMVP